MTFTQSEIVVIDYTNWKGNRRKRRIIPARIEFTRNEYHPEFQYLLIAWDLDEQAYRYFAMKDVHSWEQQA